MRGFNEERRVILCFVSYDTSVQFQVLREVFSCEELFVRVADTSDRGQNIDNYYVFTWLVAVMCVCVCVCVCACACVCMSVLCCVVMCCVGIVIEVAVVVVVDVVTVVVVVASSGCG